jgi:hypothetical protein
MTNSAPDADPAQTTVYVDVDPKVAAAVVAWATQVVARAVWTASGTKTPWWIAMVVALLDDLATQLAHSDGQAVGTAGQAGTTKPTSTAGAHGALLWGVFARRVAPAAPPSPPPDAASTVPATAGRALDELGAARLAVDAADTLAVAQRVGDAQDVAHALVAYEQASLAYHLAASRPPGGEADGGAGS